MAKRTLRKTNRTVLIVVEGDTEEAFTNHIKRLYYRRGMQLSIHIKNAHGHGPQGIISKLKAVTQTAEYGHCIAVFDDDIPLKPAEIRWLRARKVQTIISNPAIEATLLNILGVRTPATTELCKRALQKHAPGDQTDAHYHERHFPLETLEPARPKVPPLQDLIVAVSTE